MFGVFFFFFPVAIETGGQILGGSSVPGGAWRGWGTPAGIDRGGGDKSSHVHPSGTGTGQRPAPRGGGKRRLPGSPVWDGCLREGERGGIDESLAAATPSRLQVTLRAGGGIAIPLCPRHQIYSEALDQSPAAADLEGGGTEGCRASRSGFPTGGARAGGLGDKPGAGCQ